MPKQPGYFARARNAAVKRWNQLERDPELGRNWRHLFTQVKNPRHVLSELLQNADDAGATTAWVSIVDNGDHGDFVFVHDGRDFTEDDFRSLCRFCYSNKRTMHTVGFRGIGFKTTFSLGSKVRLRTPTLSTRFEEKRFTEPIWESSSRDLGVRRTHVRVPIADAHKRQALEDNIKHWTEHAVSLLFFHNLRKLIVRGAVLSTADRRTGPVQWSEWVRLPGGPEVVVLRSPRQEIPDGSEDSPMAEIRDERDLDDDSVPDSCFLDLVLYAPEPGRLFAVLPTGVRTGLPFSINAPFIQDPARTGLKDTSVSPTNRWLLEQAGRFACRAMLEWLERKDLSIEERCKAYALMPKPPAGGGNDLADECTRICAKAFQEELQGKAYVLTEGGDLAPAGTCIAVPPELHGVWPAKQLARVLVGAAKPILSRHARKHRSVLAAYGAIEVMGEKGALAALATNSVPKPRSRKQLLDLWAWVAPYIKKPPEYSWERDDGHRDVRIVPVQGSKTLHEAADVVRDDAWDVLTKDDRLRLRGYLNVLDPAWLAFLNKEEGRAKQTGDKPKDQAVRKARAMLDVLGLGAASTPDTVISQAAERLLESDPAVADLVRLAHIAAALDAEVPEFFGYVTRDSQLRTPDAELIADLEGDLAKLVEPGYCREHLLHRDYSAAFNSCTKRCWANWVRSGKSRLHVFPPLKRRTKYFFSWSDVKEFAEMRMGSAFAPYYSTYDYRTEDWDVDSQHWQHWTSIAASDPATWGRIGTRLLRTPVAYWSGSLDCDVKHCWGYYRRVVACCRPAWIVNLRDRPCIPDTEGNYQKPTELYRLTHQTKGFEGLVPFVRTDLDTEEKRPLLDALGVRSSGPGVEEILHMLRALVQAKPRDIERLIAWYTYLSRSVDDWSDSDVTTLEEAFRRESLVLTSRRTLAKADDVYWGDLTDEEKAEGYAVHPRVQHLKALWDLLGVAERPVLDPQRVLRKLSELVKADSPDLGQLRGLYESLAKGIEACTQEARPRLVQSIKSEPLVYTDAGEWARASEVFLDSDESFGEAPTVHHRVRNLPLWRLVGIADRPTPELVLERLKGLPTGRLNETDLKRVNSAVRRWPVRVWRECGRWLNLLGEFAATEALEYACTKHRPMDQEVLGDEVKGVTADFQMLDPGLLEAQPFSELPNLAQCVEEHIEAEGHDLQPPKPWMKALGGAISRIRLDDEKEQARVRELGQQLGDSAWAPSGAIKVTLKLDGKPIGSSSNTAKAVWAWKEGRLCVASGTPESGLAKHVAEALMRGFKYDRLNSVFLLCYARESQFIEGVLIEEGFELDPEPRQERAGTGSETPSPETISDPTSCGRGVRQAPVVGVPPGAGITRGPRGDDGRERPEPDSSGGGGAGTEGGRPDQPRDPDPKVTEKAMAKATAYERQRGARVTDVSTPEAAKQVLGVSWPGFDLISEGPGDEKRSIEVKGLASGGAVQLTQNEWRAAEEHGEQYWLYVITGCLSESQTLYCVQDPFGKDIGEDREYPAVQLLRTIRFDDVRANSTEP